MAAAVGVSNLLASAFSSTLGSTVVTYDKCQKGKHHDYFTPLDIDQLFNVSHLYGKFGEKPTVFSDTPPFDIYINTLSGKTLTVSGVVENETVTDIKEKISEFQGVPLPAHQRLIFGGK